MPLRKCASCGGDLPAGVTARAKFCSVNCRVRAHRSREKEQPLSLVRSAQAEASPVDTSERLSALEAAAARLNRLLDEADPRSAAPLNKEYRETLRELEALRAESRTEGRSDRTGGRRRPFDAAAL